MQLNNARFIWAAIFFIFLFYKVSLHPLWLDIQQARDVQRARQQELLFAKKLVAKVKTHKPVTVIELDAASSISQLVDIAMHSGLTLDGLYPMNIKNNGSLKIAFFKLVLEGGMHQFSQFLQLVNSSIYLMGLEEVIIKDIDKDTMKIEMIMKVFNVSVKPAKQEKIHMKWIGYMKENNNSVALVKLGNSDLIEVKSDSGWNENTMRMISMNAEHLTLRFRGKEFTLHYNS